MTPFTLRTLLGPGWIGLVMRTTICLVAVVALYAVFWVGPKQIRPGSLTKAQQTLAQQQAQLTQAQLAVTALGKLNPPDIDFNDQRETLLAKLTKPAKLPRPVFGVGLTEAEKAHLTRLTEEGNILLNRQADVATQAAAFGAVVRQLYRYPPDRDLGLDLATQKEAVAQRARKAADGLGAIAGRLNVADPAGAQLRTDLQAAQASLGLLAQKLSEGQIAEAETTRSGLMERIAQLKRQAWTMEQALWQTEAAKQLRADYNRLLKEDATTLVELTAQRRAR